MGNMENFVLDREEFQDYVNSERSQPKIWLLPTQPIDKLEKST